MFEIEVDVWEFGVDVWASSLCLRSELMFELEVDVWVCNVYWVNYLSICCGKRILRYWNGFSSEDTPVLLKHAVLHQKQLLERNKPCWLRKMQGIFDGAGSSAALSYTGCGKELANMIMLRYRDQYIRSWHQNLRSTASKRGNGGNRLRTYQLFKK